MNSIKSLFNIFFLIVSLNEAYSQSLTDKYALFDSIATDLVENAKGTGILPISSITTDSSCKSTCPCGYLYSPIINLSNKQLNITSIDNQGNLGTPSTSTANAGPISYYAYQNHCYKIQLDANDPNSQSIYIKLPMNNGTYYIGDFANLKQAIYNSSWLNNTNLTVQNLQQVKVLADYQKVKPINPDFQLIRSTYYDDSADFQQLIKAFFNSFNSTNKFIDPLFNPLNGVVGYSAKRVSELVIQIPGNSSYVKPIVIDQNNLQYDDSDQTVIGNCYMDSAFTSIYTLHPNLILEKFIMPELMNQTGIVAVKLWSKLNQQWRLVVMDDYLDVSSSNWLATSPSGVFRNIFWHPFLEKAFAKQVTSFYKLSSGQSFLNNDVIWNAILGPHLNQQYYVYLTLNNTNQSNNIINYFQNGGVFSLQTYYPSNGYDSNSTCLINLHAYALVDLRVNVANSGRSFIRAQNPWGHNGEWCGDWGDSSPLWNQYPAIRNELNFVSKNDGAFWFDINDAGKLFTVYTAATVKNA